jgi:hypothetical protein
MTNYEKEREIFDEFRFNSDIDSWEEGIFYSLWKIDRSIEKLTKEMKKANEKIQS